MMPYPEEGFWAPLDVIGVDAMRCFIEDNCPGGSGSTCFMSPSNLSACIADINGNDKESEFGSSVICEEGSYGRLCDQWSRRQESVEDELDDEDIDDSGGISSGWWIG